MSKELWRRNLDDVVEALRAADGKCVVLIGAGCSKSAGIPLAGGLIREIETRFSSAYARAVSKGTQHNYNKLMLELTTEQRRQLLRGHIDKARVNWAHLALAQLFKHRKVDRVLTVNFDPLLVRACALVGYYPAIYDLATASRFRSAAIAPDSVFYLNGQHTGFVTLNTETELSAHRQRLKEIVDDTGTRRTWIIAGYSGEADPLLEVIAEQANFDGGLYWVGHSPDPSNAVKKSLLEPENGELKDAFYVGDQDADRFFLLLAQKLEVFPPTILDDPLCHLRELVKNIDFGTGGSYEQSLEASLYEKLDRCACILNGDDKDKESNTVDPEKWLLSGKYEQVLDWYQQLEKPGRQEQVYAAWAHLLIGNDYFEKADLVVQHDLAEARRLWGLAGDEYQAALAIKADSNEALNNWGSALSAEARSLSSENLQEARRLWGLAREKYQAALAIKADKHDALYNWGMALSEEARSLSGEDMAEARRLWCLAGEKYQEALAIKADKHEALYNWGNALSAEARLLSGENLAEARRLWGLAREKYQAALAIKADKHEALCNWGNALSLEARSLSGKDLVEARRLWGQAGEKYQAVLAIKTDLHEALFNWGFALEEEARSLSGEDLAEARRLRGLAGEKYQEALAIKADKHEALYNWGNVLSAEARTLCGEDLTEARRLWGLAGEKYQAALAIKADLHEALYNWGSALDEEARSLSAEDLTEAQRLWRQAEEKFQAGLAIQPSACQFFNGLANVYLQQWHAVSDTAEKQQLLVQARFHLTQSESHKPGSGAYNLACSYAMEGQVMQCLDWLKLADQHGVLPQRAHLEKDRDLDLIRKDEQFQVWWKERFL